MTGLPSPVPSGGRRAAVRPAAAGPGRARAAPRRPRDGAAAALTAGLAALAALASVAALPPRAAAQEEGVLTQQEALRLAFGEDAEIERRTAFLEPAELERADELAGSGVEVEDPLVTHYVARRGGQPAGVAYFDAHTVRTLTEVLMIVVGTDGRVERVEVLRFDEPQDYHPPAGWLDEFDGVRLSDGSARDVPNITGATLTADAVEDAVRRTLALHRVIDPFGGDAGDGGAARPARSAPDAGGRGDPTREARDAGSGSGEP